MKIAVIPARGGSKRIPRKNIKLFHGKPMIAWSIETALASGLFDRVVVSTDDEEIADIAQKFGAEVPFVRPESLSNDIAPTVPVIAHAITACEDLEWRADFVCCIYPCAPFIAVDDLVAGLEVLERTDASYVYPVTEFPHPIQRAMLRSEQGEMSFINPEYEMMRTQDLPKTYHDAGQFYWGKANAWKNLRKMHSEGLGLVVPHWRIVDIDTDDDWERAESLFQVITTKLNVGTDDCN